jgi:hypothetical protein
VFNHEHKVVLAQAVGERKPQSANKLIKNVYKKVTGVPAFCSDGLKFYENALLKFCGHITAFPRTCQREGQEIPNAGTG